MNPRQQRFVAEYLQTLNATQAAVAAGYSPRSAYSTGHRMLKDAEICDALVRGTGAKLDAAHINAAWVLRRLVEISESDATVFEKLKALELIGRHIAVGAFAESKTTIGTLVILRDYSGHGPVAPPIELPVIDVQRIGA